MMNKIEEINQLELYLHIPFCMKKCAYCDFLSFASSENERELYVQALRKEMESYGDFAKSYKVPTIFLGGGTPSILKPSQIEQIMETVRQIFTVENEAEITMEVNPGTVSLEKLQTYKRLGINRISFGLQTTNNKELKMLGRIHSYEEFLESYEMARKAGFENINVDLISAIPEQTLESWEQCLECIVALGPEHISAYSLIIEEGTPFYDMKLNLPDEDCERRMYLRTEEILSKAGYHRYEISNYAKSGYECKHNVGYWARRNYLGLGLGAASLVGKKRFANTRDKKEYIEHCKNLQAVRVQVEELDKKACMEETMFLGLRMMEGVSKRKFYENYGCTMESVYGKVIRNLAEEGLLINDNTKVALTKKGIDVSNGVMAEFLL